MTATELDSIEAIAKEGFVINPQTTLKLIVDLRKAIGALERAKAMIFSPALMKDGAYAWLSDYERLKETK